VEEAKEGKIIKRKKINH